MKKVLIILLVIGIAGVIPAIAQTLEPYGYMELAYVPKRTFFERYENEFMSKIGFGLKINLNKFQFNVDWSQTAYASKSKSIFFNPNTQIYDYSMAAGRSIGSCNISLFFSHQCIHPVDKYRFCIYDSERKKYFQIYSTSFTQIGLRFEF